MKIEKKYNFDEQELRILSGALTLAIRELIQIAECPLVGREFYKTISETAMIEKKLYLELQDKVLSSIQLCEAEYEQWKKDRENKI